PCARPAVFHHLLPSQFDQLAAAEASSGSSHSPTLAQLFLRTVARADAADPAAFLVPAPASEQPQEAGARRRYAAVAFAGFDSPGSDFKVVVGAASVGRCVELCTQAAPRCVAFTFTDKDGGGDGAERQKACALKDAVGPRVADANATAGYMPTAFVCRD
ncbi:hypothetical protein HK405_013987, partial [Cladochytrium tenue]